MQLRLRKTAITGRFKAAKLVVQKRTYKTKKYQNASKQCILIAK